MTKPSSAGNITQTTTNPTQAAQLPFLQSLWGQTRDLGQSNPFQYYPGQTLANFDPNLAGGYNSIAGAAGSNASNYPSFMNALQGTATGNGPLQPALQQTADYMNLNQNRVAPIAAGNSATQQRVSGLSDQLAGSPYPGMLTGLAMGGNPMVGQSGRTLGQEASGAYLNSNPYLDSMFGNAANQVGRAYQTTTAPQTDSNYEAAGRYGSGALANSRSQNQQDLGQTLNGLASNIYGTNYANERGLQNSAAGTLGNLGLGYQGLQGSLLGAAGNQHLTGLSNAGQLGLGNLNSQIGASNSINSSLDSQARLLGGEQTAATQALSLYPSLASSAYQPGQMQVQAGQGLTGMNQQQIADQMARFYGNIQAPWTNLQTQGNLFGQPTTGSNSQTTPLMGPSPLSSALGIGGGLNSLFGSGGIGSGLFGAGGLGSLFGGAGVDAGISGAIGSSLAGTAASGVLPEIGAGALTSFLPLLFSDRRLKEDITPIGALANALPVYSFRYIGNSQPQIGLMADEVEKVHPEAVVEGPLGFKMVDYEKAVR